MARRGDNIHKRKDGRWEGRYKNGYREDGTVKYSSVYAYTYYDCKKKLTEAQSSLLNPVRSVKTEKSFSDLVIGWMRANQIRLKGATEAKYKNIIETHIIPALGSIKLAAINSNIINVFLDNQLYQGGLKNHKPLSPSYVRTMAIIIEAAINYGVKEGLCTPLQTPINKPNIPPKKHAILSHTVESELTEILLHDSSNVAIGVLIALQAGLRIGEVCALRWSDIDFETGSIVDSDCCGNHYLLFCST